MSSALHCYLAQVLCLDLFRAIHTGHYSARAQLQRGAVMPLWRKNVGGIRHALPCTCYQGHARTYGVAVGQQAAACAAASAALHMSPHPAVGEIVEYGALPPCIHPSLPSTSCIAHAGPGLPHPRRSTELGGMTVAGARPTLTRHARLWGAGARTAGLWSPRRPSPTPAGRRAGATSTATAAPSAPTPPPSSIAARATSAGRGAPSRTAAPPGCAAHRGRTSPTTRRQVRFRGRRSPPPFEVLPQSRMYVGFLKGFILTSEGLSLWRLRVVRRRAHPFTPRCPRPPPGSAQRNILRTRQPLGLHRVRWAQDGHRHAARLCLGIAGGYGARAWGGVGPAAAAPGGNV